MAPDARRRARQPGKAVPVDPIKPVLKVPGTIRLKLKCDYLLSSFAFKLCFQDLLSSFAFKLCFQALLSSFAFKLCFQALLPSFGFKCNLRRYNLVAVMVLATTCTFGGLLTRGGTVSDTADIMDLQEASFVYHAWSAVMVSEFNGTASQPSPLRTFPGYLKWRSTLFESEDSRVNRLSDSPYNGTI